jgi:transposase
VVETSRPADHGLPGSGWTLKKLKQWVFQAFGLTVSRNSIRRALRRAKLTWKEVKKLLGKADPQKRAAHVRELLKLFSEVCDGEVILIYVDEVHIHRDLDLGYTWGRRGQRLWRVSDCPPLSDRLNGYGAYDFTNGECLLWQNGWCNGQQTVQFLRELASWRAGKRGRLVLIWDDAPCHVAKVVTAEAARWGIEIVRLPGYSPDLNPIERLWDGMREEVTRGFCHGSASELIASAQAFIARINGDPLALIDRLWPKFDLDPEFEEKLRVST